MGIMRGYAGLGPQHLGWWKFGASVMSAEGPCSINISSKPSTLT